MKYEGERFKTEQSPSLSSTDHWQDKEEERRRRGMVQGEGSSRGHEELEASAKEPVMTRLPSDQKHKEKEGKETEHFRNKEEFRTNFSQASFTLYAFSNQ